MRHKDRKGDANLKNGAKRVIRKETEKGEQPMRGARRETATYSFSNTGKAGGKGT